jgi:DNA-binding beta-propeller fold protein YncE
MFVEIGRGFNHPYDVAPAPDGRLFVLSRSNIFDAPVGGLRIGVVNHESDYLAEFGSYGSEPGQLIWPNSMVLDAQGRLVVSDEARHDVQVFEQDGTLVRAWGGPGSGDGQFDRAAGIAIDPDGVIYVADAGHHRIQKFDPEGRFLGAWGSFGSADGQLNMPWGVALDAAGDVYVADWRNDRVQKFDPNGRHLVTFGSCGDADGQFKRPAGLAVDRDGNVIVADWGNDRVQILRPDGSHLATLTGEATLSRWGREFLESSPDVVALREVAADLEPEKRFWGVVSVRLDGEGRLYTVEHSRHRVQIYERA